MICSLYIKYNYGQFCVILIIQETGTPGVNQHWNWDHIQSPNRRTWTHPLSKPPRDRTQDFIGVNPPCCFILIICMYIHKHYTFNTINRHYFVLVYTVLVANLFIFSAVFSEWRRPRWHFDPNPNSNIASSHSCFVSLAFLLKTTFPQFLFQPIPVCFGDLEIWSSRMSHYFCWYQLVGL